MSRQDPTGEESLLRQSFAENVLESYNVLYQSPICAVTPLPLSSICKLGFTGRKPHEFSFACGPHLFHLANRCLNFICIFLVLMIVQIGCAKQTNLSEDWTNITPADMLRRGIPFQWVSRAPRKRDVSSCYGMGWDMRWMFEWVRCSCIAQMVDRCNDGIKIPKIS